MASYLQVENISKSYGEKVLFDRISFNINEGDKIALIAPNGSGKTSLLNILSGKDHSDSGGTITFLRSISCAYLEQEFDADPSLTVFEQVFRRSGALYSAVHEYEEATNAHDDKRLEQAIAQMDHLDGWNYRTRIEQTLTHLKLTRYDQPLAQLSGGEIKRLALAVMLLQGADFLIMDEPTNHLDIEVIEYLEDTLRKSRCTLFMVTHDRYFLDRVCNTIYELDHGVLYQYKGNYEAFLEKREERLANAAANTDKARNLLRRELEWIRSTPCARTGKAKYRIDAFYELKDRAQYVFEQDKLNLNVQAARLGKKIIQCKNLQFYYGDRCMLRDFTYNFSRYEKVGIVGDNGVGKSTFLNLLLGNLQADGGTLEHGETLVFGYYRQEGMAFKEDQTIFDVVHDIAETVTLADGKRVGVNTFLNYFLFPPNTHNTKISRLSGGERRRLYLLCILMRNPNFLILDEPTNDLDIMTLNVLEDYLRDFRGCLLIVSHDRYFLDKLADHLFIFTGDGKVKDYVGKCSDYRRYMKELEARQQVAVRAAEPAPKPAQEVKKEAAPRTKPTWKEQRQIEQLEASLAALEEEKAQCEALLSRTDVPLEEITKASERMGEILRLIDSRSDQLLSLY